MRGQRGVPIRTRGDAASRFRGSRAGTDGALSWNGWPHDAARPDGGEMSKFAKMLVAPAFIFAAACGGSDDENRMDDALSKDLALAASVQPYQPQQFMSPYEMQYGPQYPQGYYQQPMYPQ